VRYPYSKERATKILDEFDIKNIIKKKAKKEELYTHPFWRGFRTQEECEKAGGRKCGVKCVAVTM